MPAGQVGELPARRRGDDQLAGVRIRERRPGALQPLRMIEDRGVAARPVRREPKLLAVPARHRFLALAVEHDVDARVAVEPGGQLGRVAVRVDHPRPVRRGHDLLRERVLEPLHLVHLRLPVVGAEDDRVALEELVRPARRLDQPADGVVAAGQRGVRGVRPLDVRGVVVVGEVEDEEVEAVARDEPAADRRRVGVDRPARPVADREGRARHVRLEEVVEEEPARPMRGTGEHGNA